MSGEVIDTDARLKFPYPAGPNYTVKVGFKSVVLASSFTKKGDSGAGVVTEGNQLVGIVTAGSDSVSVFSRIEPIFRNLI